MSWNKAKGTALTNPHPGGRALWVLAQYPGQRGSHGAYPDGVAPRLPRCLRLQLLAHRLNAGGVLELKESSAPAPPLVAVIVCVEEGAALNP